MNPTEANPAPPDEAEAKYGLMSASFLGLLGTLFLGAFNDNMFRWLAVPIIKDIASSGAEVVANREAQARALSVGLASFVVPFILLATPAGYLADRFSKRSVMIGCKFAELLITGFGVLAIWINSDAALYVAVFLMGAHSAVFAPSKYGSLPEMLRPGKLSAANGLFGLTTVVAAVLGTGVGPVIYEYTKGDPGLRVTVAACALLGVAAVGFGLSFLIARLPVANPERTFPWTYVTDTWNDLKLLASHRAIFRVALGIAFFWSLASLSQINVDPLVTKELGKTQEYVGTALGVMAAGLGIGSVLAGYLSGGRIELGLVPLGGFGMVASTTGLYFFPEYVYMWMVLLGVGAGVFDVPLEAYIQQNSPTKSRGSMLAANNFITYLGMLAVAGIFYLLYGVMHVNANTIFLLAGLTTIPVIAYIVAVIPWAVARFFVWLASHTLYHVRVHGHDNLPPTGGALLIPNHVSWMDGLFLLMSSSRPIRMIAYGPYLKKWPVSLLAKWTKVIPIAGNHKSIRAALETARQAVLDGELVCIFAEGSLTRTGNMLPFQRGFMKIIEGTNIPVVPVYLDELWGSIFSHKGGKFFWKWPSQWPYPVSILFGPAISNPEDVHQVRSAVQKLGVDAVEKRKDRERLLPRVFLRECRKSLFRLKVADSMGTELSGAKLLMGSICIARVLKREVLAKDENMVGVLLPPSAGGAVVNAALPLIQRTSVNLNYTVTSDVLNACNRQAGIKHVLTTEKVLEKLDVKLDAELVYVDQLKKKITFFDKLMAGLQTFVLPSFVTERMLGLTRLKADDTMTVIFTSGSTGEPKGVMLTYSNVGSNVRAIDQVVDLDKTDGILGVLPFFHSFGYTVSLWAALTLKPKGVYHFSPLDAKQIGKLCHKYRCTLFLATPTFLRTYLRRCEKEELQSLDLVIVGAEKLPPDLAQAFQEKFGVLPQEGYGTTELSPLVSVNLPDFKGEGFTQTNSKIGTVGRPVPGVAAKVVHPETGAELGADEPGMLLIRGPNVMKGYLNKPAETAEKIRDGWYVTGDIALIDTDGFIKITGRQSRFSKIGGEMVPHVKIEETIAKILGSEEDLLAVVTAVPDPKKGERIVIVHKSLPKTPDEICKGLSEAGLPNLWIPSHDSFMQVEEIPVLGSGKLALNKVKELALEKYAKAGAEGA